VRYRLPPAALARVIDASAFDLYDDAMPTLAALEAYATDTSSVVIGLAARILSDGREPANAELIVHAGVGLAIAGVLRALPVHASRRQLYVPQELLQRYGAQAEDLFAGRETAELRAALAELRLHARRHLAAAGTLFDAAQPAIVPALLPVALARPAFQRMERRGYKPLRPDELPQWRRQWILWRAARRPSRIFG
jgi:phytoene synthase